MTKPITQPQIAQFWLERYVSPSGHCGLCGNAGIINTKGKVFTATGEETGIYAYCICPNGRIQERYSKRAA